MESGQGWLRVPRCYKQLWKPMGLGQFQKQTACSEHLRTPLAAFSRRSRCFFTADLRPGLLRGQTRLYHKEVCPKAVTKLVQGAPPLALEEGKADLSMQIQFTLSRTEASGRSSFHSEAGSGKALQFKFFSQNLTILAWWNDSITSRLPRPANSFGPYP